MARALFLVYTAESSKPACVLSVNDDLVYIDKITAQDVRWYRWALPLVFDKPGDSVVEVAWDGSEKEYREAYQREQGSTDTADQTGSQH